MRRTGKVVGDRFHARPLTSPRAVRNTLAYVLSNWRHHGEDRAHFARRWKVDPFSTGAVFTGWKELEGAGAVAAAANLLPRCWSGVPGRAAQADTCTHWHVELSAQIHNSHYDQDGNLIYGEAYGTGYASQIGAFTVVGDGTLCY